jgi:hypothetical protein
MKRIGRYAAVWMVALLTIASAIGPLADGAAAQGSAGVNRLRAVSSNQEETVTPEASETVEETTTESEEATATETETPPPTETVEPTATDTAEPTTTETTEPTATETETPAETPTAETTATETAEATVTETVAATKTPTQTPTATPTKTPTKAPIKSAAATPTIAISGSPAKNGDTITITYTNWQTGSRVVYLDRVNIGSINVGSNKKATFTYTVQGLAGGSHEISTYSDGVRIKKTFTVKGSFTVSPTSVKAGGSLTFSAKGFQSSETVKVRFYDSASSSTYKVLGSFKVGTNGAGSKAFAIPTNATTGAHKVAVVGSVYSPTGTVTVIGQPTITISGSPAKVGDTITITFTNWQIGTRNVYLDRVYVGEMTVGSSRSFVGELDILATAGGTHEISAYSDGVRIKKTFTVKSSVTLNLSTVTAGKKLSFTAWGFKPGETVKARLYASTTSSTYKVLGSFTIGSNGSATKSFTIPAGEAAGLRKVAVVGGTSGIGSVTIRANPDAIKVTYSTDFVSCSVYLVCYEEITFCLEGAPSAYVNRYMAVYSSNPYVAIGDTDYDILPITDNFSASDQCEQYKLYSMGHVGATTFVVVLDVYYSDPLYFYTDPIYYI